MWMRGLKIKRVSDRDVKSQNDQLVIEKHAKVLCEGVLHEIGCTQGLDKELAIGVAMSHHDGHPYWHTVQTDEGWTLTKSDVRTAPLPDVGSVKKPRQPKKDDEELYVTRQDIFLLTAYFQENALLYKHTGVTHSAAFASREDLTCFAEDLYQMSAVYKILGQAVLEGHVHDIMIVSGRVDLALVSAAVAAGVKILVSRTGVTDKAFDYAQQNDLTMVGFARGMRFNMYTHSERIKI